MRQKRGRSILISSGDWYFKGDVGASWVRSCFGTRKLRRVLCVLFSLKQSDKLRENDYTGYQRVPHSGKNNARYSG